MKVVFSPAAKDDLLEIALYIAQDNPTRALSFVDELEAKSLRLGQAAGIGAPRPELGEGVRRLCCVIFRQARLDNLRTELGG